MQDTTTITLEGYGEIELEVTYFQGTDYYEAITACHDGVDILHLLRKDVVDLINAKLTEKFGWL